MEGRKKQTSQGQGGRPKQIPKKPKANSSPNPHPSDRPESSGGKETIVIRDVVDQKGNLISRGVSPWQGTAEQLKAAYGREEATSKPKGVVNVPTATGGMLGAAPNQYIPPTNKSLSEAISPPNQPSGASNSGPAAGSYSGSAPAPTPRELPGFNKELASAPSGPGAGYGTIPGSQNSPPLNKTGAGYGAIPGSSTQSNNLGGMMSGPQNPFNPQKGGGGFGALGGILGAISPMLMKSGNPFLMGGGMLGSILGSILGGGETTTVQQGEVSRGGGNFQPQEPLPVGNQSSVGQPSVGASSGVQPGMAPIPETQQDNSQQPTFQNQGPSAGGQGQGTAQGQSPAYDQARDRFGDNEIYSGYYNQMPQQQFQQPQQQPIYAPELENMLQQLGQGLA